MGFRDPNRSPLPWRTATVVLLFVGYAGYYLCRSNFSAALPLLIEELAAREGSRDLARAKLGDVAALGTLAYAIGKFLAGGLADRRGGRGNFLLGLLGACVCTALFALGGSIATFGLAWVGNRFLQSFGWVGLVKIASRWFPRERQGTVMALLSLSYLWGDWLARLFLAELLRRGLDWRTVFFVASAILAGLFLINALFLREAPGDVGLAEPPAGEENVYGRAGQSAEPVSLAGLIGPPARSKAFRLACGLSFGYTIARETFNTWTPEYFVNALGLSAAEASRQSAWFPLLGGASVILAGVLYDRLGRAGRATILTGGLVFATIALTVLALGDLERRRATAVALVSAIGFLLIGPYSYLAGAIAVDFGGKRGGATASGLIDGVGYLGGILAGGTFARLVSRLGWKGAFLALAGVTAVSAVTGLLFRNEQLRPKIPPRSAP